MTRPRRRLLRWAVLIAGVVSPAEARAAVEEGTVVSVRVVSSPAEARETREVLSDLLSRIGIAIADATSATRTPLIDVEIDLSTGQGGPFVALATREPAAIICRRFLSPQASREVLVESAAEVAYAAVESRVRAMGALPAVSATAATRAAAEAPASHASNTPPAAAPPPPPELAVAADAPSLEAQATAAAPRAGYGVDAAAFAEMQLRGIGSGLPAAGGGVAFAVGLRRVRLDPALALSLAYLRSVGAENPAAPEHFSIVSTRVGATIDAFASRWIAFQLGPSVAFDFVRGDAPPFTQGPPFMMMQMTGENASFSGLAVRAGGAARLAIRVAPSSHVFVAAGADYQLRQAAPGRDAGALGPPNGVMGAPAQWMDASTSWRSSVLVGLAFTLAGRSLLSD